MKGLFSKIGSKNSNTNTNTTNANPNQTQPQQQQQYQQQYPQQQQQYSQQQQQQQQYQANVVGTAMNIAQDDEFKTYAKDAAKNEEVQKATGALAKDKGVQSGLKTMFIGQITGNQDKIQSGQSQMFQSAMNNQQAKDSAKALAQDKEFRDKTFKMAKNQYKKNEDAIKQHAKQGAQLGWKGAKMGFNAYMNSQKK